MKWSVENNFDIPDFYNRYRKTGRS